MSEIGKQEKKRAFSRWILFGAVVTVVVFPLHYTGMSYYLMMIAFPAGSNFPYRCANKLGENGHIYFIKMGLRSAKPSVRSLMISPAMDAYLEKKGGDEEIWEIIVELIKNPISYPEYRGPIGDLENHTMMTDKRYLMEYVYGRCILQPNGRTRIRQPYFSLDKIRWANVHLFNREENYGIAADDC